MVVTVSFDFFCFAVFLHFTLFLSDLVILLKFVPILILCFTLSVLQFCKISSSVYLPSKKLEVGTNLEIRIEPNLNRKREK